MLLIEKYIETFYLKNLFLKLVMKKRTLNLSVMKFITQINANISFIFYSKTMK